MNYRSFILMRVGSFVLLLSFLLQPQSSVSALTTLTLTPITWNVIGLDSNNVNVGPNHFPIAVRVCNTGSESATNVTAVYNWDSTNTYINIRPSTLSTVSLGTLAPSTCADVYFEVEVTRNSSAYDTTRDYHISVTAGNVTGTVNTPVRQLYVEHLVSQNRNATTNVEFGISVGTLASVPAGGTMNLMVGNTYFIRLTGFTATQGYEQLETFLNIPNTIFQTLSVSTTYTADTSATVSSPNDKLYGDGCVWENDQSDPDYRSCLSTGKVGGNITVTYEVRILQVPGSPLINPVPLSSLIYDFSGSSYHYNADYSVSTRYANIVSATIVKAFSPKSISPAGTSTLTFTITNPGSNMMTDVNFTDTLPISPAQMTISGTGITYTGCGSPSPSSLTNGATSVSFSNITVAGSSTCTIAVTVTAATAGTYTNNSNNLFIDTFDTGSSGRDTLLVSSGSACVPGQTLVQWTVPSTSTTPPDTATGGAGSPTTNNTGFTATASANLPASADIITDGSGGANTYSWRTYGYQNAGQYIQFVVDTRNYTNVQMSFYISNPSVANGPNTSSVQYDNGSGLTAYTPNPTIIPVVATWTQRTIDFTGLTSTTGTTTFRIAATGAANNNSGASLNYDLITFTGCAEAAPAPTITKSFSPDPVVVGATTTLTFTINNTASGSQALTGISFTDVLPAGLSITNSTSSACGGTNNLTTTAATRTISLTSGSLSANSSCNFNVTVTGSTAGSYTNITDFLSSTQSGTTTSYATDTITVIAPPVIQKSFTANPIFTGDTTTLNFSINNPNTSTTLTGIAFTDTLPTGLDVVVVVPSTQCGGTLTLTDNTPAADTVVLTGGSLVAGDTCSFSVNVTGTTIGLKTNSVTVSSTNGGTGNTDTADVVVRAQTPTISTLKSVSTSSSGPWSPSLTVTLPGSVYYRFIVENVGDIALSDVNISDPNVTTSTCTWIDGSGTTISTSGANFSLPVANASDTHIASCIIGPITALSETNPNTVTADDNNPGTSTTSDTSTATYTGIQPNLTVSKTDNDTDDIVVLPSETFDWTITVTNNGTATANFANTQVIMSDALPGLSTYYSQGSLSVANGATAPTGTIECSISGTSLSCVANGAVTLPPNASFSVAFTVTPTSTGSLANTAVVDPNNVVSESNETTTDNQSSNTITVQGIDISLIKDVSDDTPNVGSNVTFTLTLSNAGPSSATNVVVTDVIPSGYTYVAASISSNTGATGATITPNDSSPAGSGLTWSVNQLDSGESVTLTYQATVLASGTYDNYAQVTAHDQTDNDSTPNNNQQSPDEDDDDTQTVTPIAVVDISLIKDVSDDTPNVGSNVTFTLTLSNAGPSSATNVVVTDVIPSGYTYVAASISSNTGATGATITPNDSSPAGSGLTWSVNQLDSGESVTLTYQATVLASGTYDNYAQVTAHDQTDNDSTPNNGQQSPDEDDDDTQTVTPNAVVAPSISKNYSADPIIVGGISTLTFTIDNPNPSMALTGVAFADTFPAGTEVAATPNVSTSGCGSPTFSPAAGNTSLSFSGGTIAASGTCTVSVDVTATTSGTKNNTSGNVSSTNAGTGNTASDSLTVNPAPSPALNITKSGMLDMTVVAPNGQADAGDVINYTITVENTGNQDLTGVSVSDLMLSNLDCDGTAGAPFVTTGFSITVGNSLSCTGSYTLTQNDLDTNGGGDGDIDNTATANSNETDPDTDDEEVDVPLAPAIQVDKTLQSSTFTNPNTLRVTYLIDVANTGNVVLTNVQVTDDLVAAFPGSVSFSVFTHFSSGTTSLTINNAFDGDTDQNLLAGTDTLQVGESGQITLIVDVDTGGDEDTYVNTAVGTGTPPTRPNVTDSGSTGAPSFVDPALTKAANLAQASIGDVVTFTITVTNNGNLPAPDVVVVDPLPAMFDVTAATVTGGPAGTVTTVSPPIGGTAPFTVTVEIGGSPGAGNNPLGVTDVVVIQITTVVNSLGNPPIVNNATLTTTDQTDNRFNNAAAIPITILSPSDGGEIPVLPDTGFAPNIITDLPAQPDDLAYSATDVILEIPSLGLKMPIVGVPLKKNGWDVTWLTNQAGWLEGSAFPSWNGNSVLTSHVTLANGLTGPFANLSKLKYGDQIIIHANGQKYTFELRSNTTVSSDNKNYFKHEELAWLTLITCKEYDEKNNIYKKRVVVRAVLVSVE